MKALSFKLQRQNNTRHAPLRVSSEKFQASNSKSNSHRRGAWCLVLLWSLVFGAWSFSIAATNPFDPDFIPPLRPPRAEIPPTFWEQHGLWIVIGSIALLAVICVAIWLLSHRRPPIAVPPEVRARQALEKLRERAEDGVVLSWVSQILRRYATSAFGLASGELTTTEFCTVIAGNGNVGPELAASMAEFLRTCDERKFAASPSKPALGAAAQALKLIQLAEVRRSYLKQEAAQSSA